MDPLSPLAIAAAIGGLVGTAYTVSQRLLDFCDGVDHASREFEVFSHEVNTFASVWMVVQPCLRNPNIGLSQHLLRTITRILADTSLILDDLSETIDRFRLETDRKIRQARHQWIRLNPLKETVQHKRLKKFTNRRKIKLQRSQIHFATTTLSVVLGVIE